MGTEATRPAYVEAVRSFFSSNEETARRGRPAAPRRKPASRPRFEGSRRSESSSPRRAFRRWSICWQGSIRFPISTTGRSCCFSAPERSSLQGRSSSGPRPRLLLAHGLRGDGRGAGCPERDSSAVAVTTSSCPTSAGRRRRGIGFAIGEDRLVNALPQAFRREAHRGDAARRGRTRRQPGHATRRSRSRVSSAAPASPRPLLGPPAASAPPQGGEEDRDLSRRPGRAERARAEPSSSRISRGPFSGGAAARGASPPRSGHVCKIRRYVRPSNALLPERSARPKSGGPFASRDG